MIKFDKDTHTYTYNDKPLISVTQLLKKSNLSPSYEFVNEELLKKSADYGSMVHKELENYIRHRKVGFSEELYNLMDYLEEHPEINAMWSEMIVNNEDIAGTIDFIYSTNKGELIIADFKTTSTIHKQTVSWQLSLYAYLYSKFMYNNIKIKVFHFTPKLKVVDLELKPIEEVEKLIESYKNGTEYLESNSLLPLDLQEELNEIEVKFIAMEEQYKLLKKQREEVADKIKLAMEENNITNFVSDTLKITYVAPITRKSIDIDALKKDHPEIANDYLKETITKSSIRITVRKDKTNE